MSDYLNHSDQATHPGQILSGMLEDYSLSQATLAKRLDVSQKHLSNLINERVSITTEMAQKLALVFTTSTDFWLNLQKNHDAIQARIDLEKQFEKEKELLVEYQCYKEVSGLGYVPYTRNGFEKYKNLLNFFGVAQLSLVKDNYCVDFRNIAANPAIANAAVWLRCGEISFNEAPKDKEFDRAGFKNSLDRVRRLTAKRPDPAFSELVEICAEFGVTVVYTPYISKTGLKGATRWMQGRPLIQLSEMHKRADAIWFSFFHEAAHIILEHSKKRSFIDWKESITAKDKFEKQADDYARDALIPPHAYKRFLASDDLEPPTIKRFAKEIGVGDDIVAGRLAYEGHIDQKFANGFIRPVRMKSS